MKRWKRVPLAAALMAAMLSIALPSCGAQAKKDKAGPSAGPAKPLSELLAALKVAPLKERSEVPDIDLKPLEGGTKKLSDYRGKALLLNFWATWCPPCRAEMPSMERLRASLLAEGVPFEIIAVDIQEDAATVREFIEQNGFTFPVFLDEQGALAARFVSRGIPTSYIVDKTGKAVGFVIGSIEWDVPEALDTFRLLGGE